MKNKTETFLRMTTALDMLRLVTQGQIEAPRGSIVHHYAGAGDKTWNVAMMFIAQYLDLVKSICGDMGALSTPASSTVFSVMFQDEVIICRRDPASETVLLSALGRHGRGFIYLIDAMRNPVAEQMLANADPAQISHQARAAATAIFTRQYLKKFAAAGSA